MAIAAGIFLAAAFAAGGLWYVRSALLRGNPVYPFYSQLFGGQGWFDPTYVDSHGRPRSPLSFLLLPWDTAMHPRLFGGENIGALYLALLLPIVLIKPKPEFFKPIAWAALGYTMLWYFMDQNIRFYFPALALWSVLAGPAARWAVEVQRGFSRTVVRTLLLVLFGFQAALAFYHFHDEAALFFGRISPGSYLSARDPSYSAAQSVNRFLKKSNRILSAGEIRGYYFDNPFTLEGDFSRMTRYAEETASFNEAMEFIKSKGFTHVLAVGLEGLPDPDEKGFRIQKICRDSRLKEEFLEEELIVNTLGIRYVLYRIVGPGPEGHVRTPPSISNVSLRDLVR